MDVNENKSRNKNWEKGEEDEGTDHCGERKSVAEGSRERQRCSRGCGKCENGAGFKWGKEGLAYVAKHVAGFGKPPHDFYGRKKGVHISGRVHIFPSNLGPQWV